MATKRVTKRGQFIGMRCSVKWKVNRKKKKKIVEIFFLNIRTIIKGSKL
jgi:hypothetical protein